MKFAEIRMVGGLTACLYGFADSFNEHRRDPANRGVRSSAGEPNRILAIYETKYDVIVFYMHVIVCGLDLMLVQAMDPLAGGSTDETIHVGDLEP